MFHEKTKVKSVPEAEDVYLASRTRPLSTGTRSKNRNMLLSFPARRTVLESREKYLRTGNVLWPHRCPAFGLPLNPIPPPKNTPNTMRFVCVIAALLTFGQLRSHNSLQSLMAHYSYCFSHHLCFGQPSCCPCTRGCRSP